MNALQAAPSVSEASIISSRLPRNPSIPATSSTPPMTCAQFSNEPMVRLPRGLPAAIQAWQSVRHAATSRARFEMDSDQVWRGLNNGHPYALHIAGAGIRPACDLRYREFIDFLVLNEHAFTRKIVGSFSETAFTETGPLRPSDHCPILVEIAR